MSLKYALGGLTRLNSNLADNHSRLKKILLFFFIAILLIKKIIKRKSAPEGEEFPLRWWIEKTNTVQKYKIDLKNKKYFSEHHFIFHLSILLSRCAGRFVFGCRFFAQKFNVAGVDTGCMMGLPRLSVFPFGVANFANDCH